MFAAWLILTALFAGIQSAAAAPAFGKKPNIIFILTDDQGYGDFSCHGNPILRTPNMDRVHDEGRRFTDFHVSPTCSPTRAALMTGRHEFKSGVTHTIYERERMSLKAVTLPQVLKQAGYTTGIFGKWHLGDEPAYQPDRRGFDEVFIHGGGGIGQTYPGSCGDAPGNSYFNPVILHNGRFEKTQGYCTDVFFRQALKWMEAQVSLPPRERVGVRERKTDNTLRSRSQPALALDGEGKTRKPFFAYIALNAPHTPLDVPPEYEALYAGVVKTNVAKFFGMIANIDDNVGRLLATLKEWGIERDTLLILMNDNGGTVGVSVYNAGMRGGKVTPWLGGTRAASFWRWPGTLEPGDIDALTAHIDVLPTLADIAGVKLTGEVARQVEGRSLVPLLKDPKAPWPDRFLFTHQGRWPRGQAEASKYRHCSVRTWRWHLVCDTNGEKRWQLFDVKADPGEQQDLASQHPEVVRELEAAYDKWWAEILPCLENENAVGPPENPFKVLYWKQFGRGPAKDAAKPSAK